MFTATKQINPRESKDYICKCYRINYADKYKRENEVTIDKSVPEYYIRTSYYFDDKKKCMDSIELQENYRFLPLPYIPLKSEEERSTIYISGASGKGKSYLLNNIIVEYKKQFKDNKVYYFTKNNYMNDRSLEPKEMYSFVDVNKFLDYYKDKSKIEEFLLDKNKQYHNSFWIFDDVAALEKVSKEASHILNTFIDIILENKRKAKMSIAILSHVPSNYKQTALLIREMKQYYAFPSNLQVKSDRILNAYLGLSSSEIQRIVNEDSKTTTWLCIDNERRIVLTQRKLYHLTSSKMDIMDITDVPNNDSAVKNKKIGVRNKKATVINNDSEF